MGMYGLAISMPNCPFRWLIVMAPLLGIKNGDLTLSYSDLEMEDAQSVEIDMKYTDVSMGSATRANVMTAYGNFRAMDIDELMYRGKYDDVVIERVKSIDMESHTPE